MSPSLDFVKFAFVHVCFYVRVKYCAIDDIKIFCFARRPLPLVARDFWKGGNKLFLGNVPPPQSRDNLGKQSVIVLLFICLSSALKKAEII